MSADSKNYHLLLDLIEDETFKSLLRLFQRKGVTWDEYLEQPLPSGISPRMMWDIQHRLGKSLGIEIKVPDLQGTMAWYRRTNQLSELAEEITALCSDGSPVSNALLKEADQYTIRQLQIKEINGAARLDGIALSKDRLEAMMASYVEPRNDIEKLILNAIAIDDDLERYRPVPFSIDLVEDIFERLCQGVSLEGSGTRLTLSCDDDPCKEHEQRARVVDLSVFEAEESERKKALKLLLEYATGKRGDEFDGPLLRGGLIRGTISYARPFGFVSSFVGSLVSRLYYLKHDLKVLCLLPVSDLWARWEHYEPLPIEVCCTPESYKATVEKSKGDYTIYQTLSMQLTVGALREFEQSMAVSQVKEDRLSHLIGDSTSFNVRQRAILARAARIPHAEFRIRYHQQKNEISYATARRDLVELEKKDYLRSEHIGKTLVFFPGERLRDLASKDAVNTP